MFKKRCCMCMEKMVFYKLRLGSNISKLINLNTVSNVSRYKKQLTITYNFNSTNGFLIFGSGMIDQEPHKEIITFDNEKDAESEIDYLQNFTRINTK